MIEGVISAAIAAVAGIFAVHGKLNQRIGEVDSRIDRVELRIAEKYVQREELSTALKKMEDHMVRIENKLDQIALRHGQ